MSIIRKTMSRFRVTPDENPLVQKTLALSTAHLPERLGSTGLDDVPGVYVDSVEGGWWVYVPQQGAPGSVVPYDLVRVLLYAHKNGCRWIFFHCDNDTTDDLPTWDW
jgi:hypothetical protein